MEKGNKDKGTRFSLFAVTPIAPLGLPYLG